MKRVIHILIILTVFLSGTCTAVALEIAQPNNKFGIHIAQPADDDINKAAELVNSNGGKWGYITLVIHEDDKDKNKWQSVFDKLREKQLIPIVRLATKGDGPNWRRPKPEEALEWAQFLNSLNWVTKNRYVILFNEPNHATEWGGSVDAKSFAEVNREFSKKLKEANKDFFVMMGGLDGVAPSQPPRYQDSGVFLRQVMEVISAQEFNELFDGLSSHSYPNPGFSGSPSGSGKSSVRGYEYELDLLKGYGVKDLPVFITETGWNASAVGREQTAQHFKTAYEQVWLPDDRVKAVTPFVLNYQSEPFLKFSWLKKDTNEPYPEYETVKNLSKTAGKPIFVEGGEIAHNFPTELVAQSTFRLYFKLKNTGQAIWRTDDGYRLVLENIDPGRYLVSNLGQMKPKDDREFDIFFTTSDESGKKNVKLVLYRDDTKILESKPWSFEIVPLPALAVNTSLFPKFNSSGDEFEIQVFDDHEELVYKQKNVKIRKGKALLPKIENIALNREYRVVLLNKYYLPTQTYITFKKGTNEIKFRKMLPLDTNADGNLSFDDTWGLFTNHEVLGKWVPW